MFGIKEITPVEAVELKQHNESVLFMDVREHHEYLRAKIDHDNVVLVPLTRLAAQGLAALPDQVLNKDQKIVVFCHHGMRSAQVVAWLKQQGWQDVVNMSGGIDAYARFVDPNVGRY